MSGFTIIIKINDFRYKIHTDLYRLCVLNNKLTKFWQFKLQNVIFTKWSNYEFLSILWKVPVNKLLTLCTMLAKSMSTLQSFYWVNVTWDIPLRTVPDWKTRAYSTICSRRKRSINRSTWLRTSSTTRTTTRRLCHLQAWWANKVAKKGTNLIL